MDGCTFDRWVRRLGVTASRRSAFRVLPAAFVALAADASAKGNDGGRNRRSSRDAEAQRDRGVVAEACLPTGKVCQKSGPRRKRCANCCSGIWKGRATRRCACTANDRRCSGNPECCSESCRSGMCQPKVVSSARPCESDADCANLGLARCRTYDTRFDLPDGRFCLKSDADPCTNKTECDGYFCEEGTCKSAVASGKPCDLSRHVCLDDNAECTKYDGQAEENPATTCLLPLGATCATSTHCRSSTCWSNKTCCVPDGQPQPENDADCCSGRAWDGKCQSCLLSGTDDDGDQSRCCSGVSDGETCCVPANGDPVGKPFLCCSGSRGMACVPPDNALSHKGSSRSVIGSSQRSSSQVPVPVPAWARRDGNREARV